LAMVNGKLLEQDWLHIDYGICTAGIGPAGFKVSPR